MNLSEKAVDMERYLESTLQPVFPRPQFIHSLKGSLNQNPGIFIEHNKMPVMLITVAIGVVTGTLLLWMISWLSKLSQRD